MPTIKWDGAEEPTINYFYIKLITENFKCALKIADRPKSTAVFHINRSILGDSYGPRFTISIKLIAHKFRYTHDYEDVYK